MVVEANTCFSEMLCIRCSQEWHNCKSETTFLPAGEVRLGKRVDYVVTRYARVKVLSMYVHDTGAASHHRPMIAYLSL